MPRFRFQKVIAAVPPMPQVHVAAGIIHPYIHFEHMPWKTVHPGRQPLMWVPASPGSIRHQLEKRHPSWPHLSTDTREKVIKQAMMIALILTDGRSNLENLLETDTITQIYVRHGSTWRVWDAHSDMDIVVVDAGNRPYDEGTVNIGSLFGFSRRLHWAVIGLDDIVNGADHRVAYQQKNTGPAKLKSAATIRVHAAAA